ncbi:MAG: UDP-N-acetylmuramate dehydrogenase [Treponema sp.]|nr:UDP-N-acetylmuramate dehydrogenase [Treponema sp.]
MKQKIKQIIELSIKKTGCEVDVRYDEPMSEHTTFKVGGPADCWLRPDGEGFSSFCISLLNSAKKEKVPVFIIGGGANIVVSDLGIRGITLDMGGWNGESVWTLCKNEEEIIFKSGKNIDEAADDALAAGLSGFEFLAGMPGTIGGALWMNARCYGSEISDFVSWVEFAVQEKGEYCIKRIEVKNKEGFAYKESPFQKMDCLILSAAFKLKKGNKEEILKVMDNNRQDRQDKGHYLYPCAGSAFKNNRAFGKPTGQIIDELGLKGFKKGGAQIADFHANIVINTGSAKAQDIRLLIDETAEKVKAAFGFELEPEILFVGDW